MSELKLSLSWGFPHDDAMAIRGVLSQHFQVRGPTPVIHQSLDPPSIIELLGGVETWKLLTAPAAVFVTAFLATLGKRAANAAWDSASEWKNNKAIKPLRDIATTLVEAADRVGGEVTISFALDIPDDYSRTVIATASRDPVEVARVLATFVVHAPGIADIVQTEIEPGHEPVGNVFVELARDGTAKIRWHEAPDMKVHERRIDPPRHSRPAQRRSASSQP